MSSRNPPRKLDTLAELLVGGAQIAGTLLGAPLLRSRYNRYGATAEELRRALPGDELVKHPKLGYTRAITIDAPPEAVWPWLVQIGQGRGGFYSFDALENLVGCDIHSAESIRPELQELQIGDRIRARPQDHPSWVVVDLEVPRHLVLVGADPSTRRAPPVVEEPPPDYVGTTWQWVLEPLDGGARTRLIVRQRLTYGEGQALLWHLVEPFNFVMERRMLHGLKRRAERSWSR
jgi:hypothetical protein